ncbi:MAG: acetolactate synthase [Clostridia bacterium]|nr:acetolactate synthase [Bacillota bacterium]MBQ6823955.1 acetolactate synthase [Clostridia bacterium]
MIKQLSVFVENKQGALVETAGLLAEKKINIRAMTLADTTKYGVLRMIVDDLPTAQAALSDGGFLTKATDVVAVAMPDTAGALHDIIEVLAKVGVNVEYLYAFNHGTNNTAYVVLRVNDIPHSEQALTEAGFPVLDADALAKM